MTSPFSRLAAVLLAMLIGSGAQAVDDKVETANATYEIRPDPKNEDTKCVFKGKTRLFCIKRELVTFGKPVRTRDYTLIPVYDDCGGSACGRSQTTLLVEKGRAVRIDRTLRRFCVECQDRFEVKADTNEVAIALDRQQGHQFSATFRDGRIAIASKPLDPKEPLSDDDCSYLYEDYLDACIGHQGSCRSVLADLPGANARPVKAMDTNYAAFPERKVEAACEAACASKKKPARASFDEEICRR